MSELKAAILPDRGVLRVGGADAREFLQGLVTNNVDLVKPGEAIYAGLLTPQGKFLFDFFITSEDGGFILDCDGGRVGELQKRLTFYKLRANITLEDLSAERSVIAFWGGAQAAFPDPASTDPRLAALMYSDPRLAALVYSDPRLAALGHRAISSAPEAAIAAAGARSATPADYHRHRIALGVGDAAQDFEPDRSFPLEVNFDELHGVDFHKGCFVGQEVTSRTKRRGSVRKRLIPCRVQGDLPKPRTPVRASGREAGTVFSGDAETGRVLALLRLDLIEGAVLEAGEATLTPERPDWAAFSLAEESDEI
ncbi:MAG: folate-binding protein [Parvibaculum sp.]|uniref:CAF17-like 4Fe-4S cluster assembly/insertion protein YgfZ n=1 Tax=Parvibaculum sp. TaxID=2024848 RepID=UPI003C77F4AA